MAVTAIETQNSLYLFDTDRSEYHRRPLSGERTPGERLHTRLAPGTLDDGVWLPYSRIEASEHPAFPDQLALRVITGPGPFDYIQITPGTDDALARSLAALYAEG